MVLVKAIANSSERICFAQNVRNTLSFMCVYTRAQITGIWWLSVYVCAVRERNECTENRRTALHDEARSTLSLCEQTVTK